jgi:hypothetical protein
VLRRSLRVAVALKSAGAPHERSPEKKRDPPATGAPAPGANSHVPRFSEQVLRPACLRSGKKSPWKA